MTPTYSFTYKAFIYKSIISETSAVILQDYPN